MATFRSLRCQLCGAVIGYIMDTLGGCAREVMVCEHCAANNGEGLGQ